MRWEHLKLTRARLAHVTNTRPLVRRLRLRIRVLGSSVNRGNGSPVAPTPDEEVSRGGERGTSEPGVVAEDVGRAVVVF